MKTNSYGIFTMELVDDKSPEDVTIFRGFNALTPEGFARLGKILAGETNEKFANYVKLGTGKLVENPTDLTTPIFGYNDPTGSWDKDTRNSFYTGFNRTTIPPARFKEVGLFWEDENKEKTLLAYADIDMNITTGAVLKTLGHQLSIRSWAESNFIDIDGKSYSYSLAGVVNGDFLKRGLQTPERYTVFTGSGQQFGTRLIGSFLCSKANTLGEYHIKLVVKNYLDAPVAINEVIIDGGTARGWDVYSQKVEFVQYSTYSTTTRFNRMITLLFNRDIILEPNKEITLGFTLNNNDTHNLLPIRNPIRRDSNVNNAQSLSTTSYEESRYMYNRKEVSFTKYSTSGWSTTTRHYTSTALSNDVYYCNTNLTSEVSQGRWMVGVNEVTSALPMPGMTYDYDTREITLATVPETIALVRVFTDLPNSPIGYEAAPVNGKITLPADLYISGEIWAQWLDTNKAKSSIRRIDTTPLPENVSKLGFIKLTDTKLMVMWTYRNVNYVDGYIPDICRMGVITDTTTYVHNGLYDVIPTFVSGTTTYIDEMQTFSATHKHIVTTYTNPVDGTVKYHVTYIDQIPSVDSLGVVSGPLASEPYENELVIPNLIKPSYSTNFRCIAPDDGEVLIFSRGPNNTTKEIITYPVVKDEVLDEYIGELFNPYSAGLTFFAVFKQGDNQSQPFRLTSGNTIPYDPDLTYDPVTNKLSGPMPLYCYKLAIKRWNVPVAEIEVDMDSVWLDIVLPFTPDPTKKYQVYAVSSKTVYSENPCYINGGLEDPIHTPLVDLSKPTDYSQASNYTGILPAPNFVKYGTEAFAGELNGEPIIKKTCVQYNDRMWKCTIESLNWKHRFMIVRSYQHSDYYNNTIDDEFWAFGLPSSPEDVGTSYRLTIWTTWLPYDKYGFDAYLSISANYVYNRGTIPYVSNETTPAMTVYEQNGYYRQVMDSYYWSWYGNYSKGHIHNFDLEYATNPKNSAFINMKIAKVDLTGLYISIDGEQAIVSHIKDETDNIVKARIATTKYVFEHGYLPNDIWEIVENNSGKEITDSTTIKILLGHTKSLEGSKIFPWLTMADGTKITDITYTNYSHWCNAYIWNTTRHFSLGWYLKPTIGYKAFPYFNVNNTDSTLYKSLQLSIHNSVHASFQMSSMVFFIDGEKALPDVDTITDTEFYIGSGDTRVRVVKSDSYTYQFFIESNDTDAHEFLIYSTSYSSAWLSISNLDYRSANISATNNLDNWSDIYSFRMATVGSYGTPLTYEPIPDLDVSKLEPVAIINGYDLTTDSNFSGFSNWSEVVSINGIIAEQADEVELLNNDNISWDNAYVIYVEDVPVYLLKYDNKYYIYTTITDQIFDIQVQTSDISNSNSDYIGLGDYVNLPDVVGVAYIDPLNRNNYNAKIAFRIDTSLYEDDDVSIPEPNFDKFELTSYDNYCGLMISPDFWDNIYQAYYRADTTYTEDGEAIEPDYGERSEFPYYYIDAANRAISDGYFKFRLNGVDADATAVLQGDPENYLWWAIIISTSELSILHNYDYGEFYDIDGNILTVPVTFDILETLPVDIRGYNNGRGYSPYRFGSNWSAYGNAEYHDSTCAIVIEKDGIMITRNARSLIGKKPVVVKPGSVTGTYLLPYMYETGPMVLDGNFTVKLNNDLVVVDESDSYVPLVLEESSDVEVEYEDDVAPSLIGLSSESTYIDLDDEEYDIVIKDMYGNVVYDNTSDYIADVLVEVKTEKIIENSVVAKALNVISPEDGGTELMY